MLKQQVDAGDLPALAERIPAEPLVVELAEPGVYGGTWRSVTLGPGDGPAFSRIVGYQPPLRKDPMLETVQPNICTEIVGSDDGTEFTLRVREGMRWSDGEPFTADDIVFAVEDVFGNTDLHGTPPNYLSHEEKLAQVEKVDDFTVKIIFPGPTGLFYEQSSRSIDLTRYPKHYASRFLPKYNDKAEQQAKDAGFDYWMDWFNELVANDGPWMNPDLPTMNAWVVTTPLGEGQQVQMERNPYFWKTDADGRQLPYIDSLSWEVVLEPQVMLLNGTDGELDLIYRHVNSSANKPVFARSREDGDYRLLDLTTTLNNSMCVALNLAHKDASKRKLYQNRDFRIGLSHAIDREELITAVWQRQGEPWQPAPTPESIFYDEEFAKQYTDYDTDLANEHLDKAGIAERGADGFRVLPDGKPLTINLDIATALFAEWPAAADIIQGMWEKVGVRMRVNAIDRTLFYDRKTWEANEHDAGVWSGDGGNIVEIDEPRWYMPWNDESIWATPWAAWFNSRGVSGVKPIPEVQRQFELYWELQATPDPAAREELFRQVLQIAKEQFWVIGILTAAPTYYLARNRLKNLIEGVPDTAIYATPAHTNTEGWFLADGA